MVRVPKKNGMSIAGLVMLLLFAIPWSGLTLLFDLSFGRNMMRQIRALGYSTVIGTITHSSVVESDDVEDGRSYRFDIRYRYLVDGSPYTGSRYRYGSDSNGDRSGHYRILASYPVGAQVEVHYSPSDPADAVLRVGAEATDLVPALGMLPFNLVMVGLWLAIYSGIRSRLWPPVAGGAKLSDDGRYVRVWLDSWTPLYAGLVVGAVVSGFLAFCLTFIVVFGFGCYPPMAVPLTAWGLVLGGGGLTCRVVYRKAARNGCELIIDDYGQSVVLPQSFGRQDKATVPWHKIVSIEVERSEKRNSKGDPRYSYVPTITFTDEDGSPRREKLVELPDQSSAEGLVEWLCERLGVEPSAVVP